jgi:hypothetical protein
MAGWNQAHRAQQQADRNRLRAEKAEDTLHGVFGVTEDDIFSPDATVLTYRFQIHKAVLTQTRVPQTIIRDTLHRALDQMLPPAHFSDTESRQTQ